MNMILRELRTNLIPLIVWSLSLGAIIFIAFVEYQAYNNNPAMNDFLEAFPPGMLAAFGMNSSNLTTVAGFTSMMSIYFYLTLAIHAGLLGSSIIGKEERDKTAEFLFTLPVKRNQVLLSKLVAAVVNLLVFNVFSMVMLILASLRYEPEDSFYDFVWVLSGGLFMLQLIFLSVGMALSSFMKDHKKPGQIVLGLILGTWTLSSIVNMFDKVDFMKYFTPFKYFEAGALLDNLSYEWVYLGITAGIVIAGISVMFVFFQKRDLYI
jgi:ABC-2 type transport system permease protein